MSAAITRAYVWDSGSHSDPDPTAMMDSGREKGNRTFVQLAWTADFYLLAPAGKGLIPDR